MSNTHHTACAVFTFKDQGSKQKFIDFCNGPKGLDITRNYKGCQSIECYQKHDNELSIVIWQKWDFFYCHKNLGLNDQDRKIYGIICYCCHIGNYPP